MAAATKNIVVLTGIILLAIFFISSTAMANDGRCCCKGRGHNIFMVKIRKYPTEWASPTAFCHGRMYPHPFNLPLKSAYVWGFIFVVWEFLIVVLFFYFKNRKIGGWIQIWNRIFQKGNYRCKIYVKIRDIKEWGNNFNRKLTFDKLIYLTLFW